MELKEPCSKQLKRARWKKPVRAPAARPPRATQGRSHLPSPVPRPPSSLSAAAGGSRRAKPGRCRRRWPSTTRARGGLRGAEPAGGGAEDSGRRPGAGGGQEWLAGRGEVGGAGRMRPWRRGSAGPDLGPLGLDGLVRAAAPARDGGVGELVSGVASVAVVLASMGDLRAHAGWW